jgi:hypothetical protein
VPSTRLSDPRIPPPLSERDRGSCQNVGRSPDLEREQRGRPVAQDTEKDHRSAGLYGAPQWAGTSRMGVFEGKDFREQSDGTLRCPAHHLLYPQERRAEHDGTLRVVYAARIGDCRACLLRGQCLAHGNETKHARRVSAVLRPIEGPSPAPALCPSPLPPTKPMRWGDWSRCQTRRRLMRLLRTQTVTVTLTPVSASALDAAHGHPLTRQQRKHARMTWEQRLARNAYGASEPRVKLHLFGIPAAFAQARGLLSVA